MSRPADKWLLCHSRGELYGLDLGWVKEIDYRPQVLPLPTAEPPLCGLVEFRGSQLPAISLDWLLGQPQASAAQASVILEVEGRRFALLVEAIGETVMISGDSLFKLDPFLTADRGFVTRAARIDHRVVFELDLIGAGNFLEGARGS